MTRYLLDANIFIEAKNRHYGFDFCPALIAQNGTGRVASIDKVGDELHARGDALSDWTTARGRTFFLPPDDPVVPAPGQVSAWATGQNYEAAAIATFLAAEAADAIVGFLHRVHRQDRTPPPPAGPSFDEHVDETFGPVRVFDVEFRASEVLFRLEPETYRIYLAEFDGTNTEADAEAPTEDEARP